MKKTKYLPRQLDLDNLDSRKTTVLTDNVPPNPVGEARSIQVLLSNVISLIGRFN